MITEELYKEYNEQCPIRNGLMEYSYVEWLENKLLKSREECKKAYDAGYNEGYDRGWKENDTRDFSMPASRIFERRG